MKKVCIGVMIISSVIIFTSSCDIFQEKWSEITVYNVPDDGVYHFCVISKNRAPELIETNFNKGWEYIALYTGDPPIRLYWYDGVKAGEYFFVIHSYASGKLRAEIVYFNSNGEIVIDWNEMTQYKP